MNEQTTPPAGPEQPAAGTTPDPTTDPTPTPRPRERAFGLRGVAAIGAATLVLGGLGGTALGFALDDHRDDRPGRMGQQFPMGGQMGGQMGGPMGGQMMRGQMGGGPGFGGFAPGQGPCVTAPDSGSGSDGSGSAS